MNTLIQTSVERDALSAPRPLTPANLTIRPGVLSDVPFLDSLQRLHTKQVGWMPTKQFEGKIKLGHVLIAEEADGYRLTADGSEADAGRVSASSPLAVSRPPSAPPTPVGYCIGNDQYFKRDDVGIVYQMNVLPGRQRGLIGAALLKAQFERSAWGCKLYCCWCAQDIAANKFWEAMGFVPLAFRTGGETKGPNGRARMHIFWQKRIRSGDTTTSWWFPSQTTGGSIRADRIVLPIPPGTHWSDAKPLVLPGMPMPGDVDPAGLPALPAPKVKRQKAKAPAPVRPAEVSSGGFWFAAPAPAVEALPVKAPREPKTKQKNDPRLIAAARELRDRWLEQVNGRSPDATPLIGQGKYDVSRAAGQDVLIETIPVKLLAA